MIRFLLIRHATNNTVGKLLAGRMEGVSLNDEGRAQAHSLAARLKGVEIHAVYSSPLERAVETAEPVAQVHNLTVTTSVDFVEVDFGAWTGRSFEELRGNLDFQHFNSFRSCTRIPGGELMLEAQARMIAGLERLRLRHDGQTVAVVGHADVIKASIAYYAGIGLDMFQRLEISPASVSVVELYPETARVIVVNDTGSLLNLGAH